MTLEDYRGDMEMCCRCSICKFIPLEKVNGYQHAYVCPSIARYDFHTYSGGGRMAFGSALVDKRIDLSDKLVEVVYNCQMCGACDVSCKYAMDMEVLEPINEVRIKCVEEGHTLSALESVIGSLRKQGTMISGIKAKRGQWAEGLDVKDATQKMKVIYHAGCRTCYDKDLWKVAQASVKLLQKAGVDVGIAGDNELCCGGRAYQMGYRADFLKQAEKNMALIKKSGARILVTGCSECYHAFKVLYDKFELKGNLEILHTTEYFDRLIKEGELKPTRRVTVKVTYHDPCHLGRQGEPYIHWEGKELRGDHIRLFDPPREFRRGTYGVYEPPRDVLRSIPGLNLVEMDRIREYAWCCGGGGGVRETNPDFAKWTATERLSEAETTGAEAIVTACPGCEQVFKDTIKANGNSLKLYDVVELLEKAI